MASNFFIKTSNTMITYAGKTCTPKFCHVELSNIIFPILISLCWLLSWHKVLVAKTNSRYPVTRLQIWRTNYWKRKTSKRSKARTSTCKVETEFPKNKKDKQNFICWSISMLPGCILLSSAIWIVEVTLHERARRLYPV